MCWRYILEFTCGHIRSKRDFYKKCIQIQSNQPCISGPPPYPNSEVRIQRSRTCPECPSDFQAVDWMEDEYLVDLNMDERMRDLDSPGSVPGRYFRLATSSTGYGGEIGEELAGRVGDPEERYEIPEPPAEDPRYIMARGVYCLYCHNYGHRGNDCPYVANQGSGNRTLRRQPAYDDLRGMAEGSEE